jgi:hypothetical protein
MSEKRLPLVASGGLSTPDYAFIRKLIGIVHAVAPPDDIGPGEFENRPFRTSDGWTVVIFYDCGELDYIDHFVSPEGEVIALWGDELDARIDDAGPERIFATLQNWRGCADTERLLTSLPA